MKTKNNECKLENLKRNKWYSWEHKEYIDLIIYSLISLFELDIFMKKNQIPLRTVQEHLYLCLDRCDILNRSLLSIGKLCLFQEPHRKCTEQCWLVHFLLLFHLVVSSEALRHHNISCQYLFPRFSGKVPKEKYQILLHNSFLSTRKNLLLPLMG